MKQPKSSYLQELEQTVTKRQESSARGRALGEAKTRELVERIKQSLQKHVPPRLEETPKPEERPSPYGRVIDLE